MSIPLDVISKRELRAYREDIKGSIFRQIRELFAYLKESGLTQKDLATRIHMDPGQLSRRLRGDFDLQIETLSDLARGLECRIDVQLTPLLQVAVTAMPRPASKAEPMPRILNEQPKPSAAPDHKNDNRQTVYELAS